MPIGGIGTGTISLGGRGQLTDLEIYNRPWKGNVPRNTFFALWFKPRGKPGGDRPRGPERKGPPRSGPPRGKR